MNRLKKELKKRYIIFETDDLQIWNTGIDESENLITFTKDVIITKYSCNVLNPSFRIYDKNYNLVAIQDCYIEDDFFFSSCNPWNVFTSENID